MYFTLALLAAAGVPATKDLVPSVYAQASPCWHPSAEEHSAGRPVTFVEVKLAKDGKLASTPIVTKQTEVDVSDQRFAQDVAGRAINAVEQCAPFTLPANLYHGGWDDFVIAFRP